MAQYAIPALVYLPHRLDGQALLCCRELVRRASITAVKFLGGKCRGIGIDLLDLLGMQLPVELLTGQACGFATLRPMQPLATLDVREHALIFGLRRGARDRIAVAERVIVVAHRRRTKQAARINLRFVLRLLLHHRIIGGVVRHGARAIVAALKLLGRVRLLGGDLGGAQEALALAETTWPEHPEVMETARVVALAAAPGGGEGSGARPGEGASTDTVVERGASAEQATAAEAFTLGGPYPNPSRGNIVIPLVLPTRSEVRDVVYDVLGREVAVLHDGPLAAGVHELSFEGSTMAPGLYVVRAAAGARVATRRITMLR